jgi:hypothetical protein
MSWAKLDDGFHSHPKILACSLEAVGLYGLALSWASSQETDGRVPAAAARHLSRGCDALVDELVRSHLWECDAEGFTIHDFLLYNPCRAILSKRRKKHKKAVDRWRAKRDQMVIDHRAISSRPPGSGRDGSGSSSSPQKKQRSWKGVRGKPIPLPEGFEVSEKMRAFAAQNMTPEEIATEFIAFKAWARSKGVQYVDWEAGWRTRCINFVKFREERRTRT